METASESDSERVSKALGLRLLETGDRDGEFAVMSPAGVRLFKVVLRDGQCMAITMPSMDDMFGERLRMRFTDENLRKIAICRKWMTRRVTDESKVFVGESLIICNKEGIDSGIRCRCISVKRERLQEISEPDAVAEGCEDKEDFRRVWGTIYKEDSPKGWAANPNVFAYEFGHAKSVKFGDLAVGDMFNVAIGRFVKLDSMSGISVMDTAAKVGSQCVFHAAEAVVPLYVAGAV